jgi:hypothetical protein
MVTKSTSLFASFILILLLGLNIQVEAQTHVIDQIRGHVDGNDDVIRDNGLVLEGEMLDEEISLGINPPKTDILIDLAGLKDPEDAFLYELYGSPMPAINTMTANLVLPRSARGVLQIFDINGRLITETSHNLKAGKSEIQLNLEQLKSGTYFLRWVDDSYQIGAQFIKG